MGRHVSSTVDPLAKAVETLAHLAGPNYSMRRLKPGRHVEDYFYPFDDPYGAEADYWLALRQITKETA